MPATHSVFGMPQTVNSATYQIVDVISRASGMRNAAALEAVVGQCTMAFPGPFSLSLSTYMLLLYAERH